MIKLENVLKDYTNGSACTHALCGVDLEIQSGEMAAIMGASGSGKSTLLHIIGGMDDLTGGKYQFENEVVSDYNFAKLQQFRKKYISFVFQNFALMNKYTVYENVEMPLLARRIKNRRKIIMEQLEKMGIADLQKKLPTQLSGGQQQRCAIARALAANTPVLLADEPTGALDSKTSAEIMNVFKELNSEGKTVIIVTHDPGVAGKCGRIIEISDGKIVSDN